MLPPEILHRDLPARIGSGYAVANRITYIKNRLSDIAGSLLFLYGYPYFPDGAALSGDTPSSRAQITWKFAHFLERNRR